MDVKKSKKNVKFTTIAWVMAIMLLIIIIPLNVAVSLFDVKLDLTHNHFYSLTDTTEKYLSGIDKKVDIYLLMDMEELENVKTASEKKAAMAIIGMIDEYKKFDCINFKDVDPETHPEIKDELNPNGYLTLTKGDIIVRCEGNSKHIIGTDLIKGVYDENGNEIGESYNGENLITGAVKSVVEGNIPSIYFLTGHGEKTLEKNFTGFRKNLEDFNYKAKELNLASADAVPEDAAVIIVPAPQKDITVQEKAKIESFLDRGGNLSLLMSPNDDDTDYTNIEDIMRQYCISMDYNIVSETDSSKHVSGDEHSIMVNLVDVSSSDDENISDLTSSLISADSLIPYMPASRSFYEHNGQNRSDLTVCPLIETYDSAVGKPYGGSATDPDQIAGKLYLGAYSEDRIRNHSKLVVMGSADFIDDENIQEYYAVPIMLYSRTITWMYNNDVDMNISPKNDTSDYMTLKSREDTKAMMILLNAAPVVVALSGIFIWLKRRHA